MHRIILHSDLNHFYASVELISRPHLRTRPVAVGGDVEARHGIILAKNTIASAYGIKTGEQIWKAREKCPDLILFPPSFEKYSTISAKVKSIYLRYSDHVESFGIDECWLDITSIARDFDEGVAIAHEIREQIHRELGVTVSVGVSFNKNFSKLASDLKKPNAVTCIDPEHYQSIVWPLPIEALLFVGRATKKEVSRLGIRTIGDLARFDVTVLERLLGKNGRSLWLSANGMDATPVLSVDHEIPLKSLGNSMTTPRDLMTEDDVHLVLLSLCDTVSTRLRRLDYLCNTVKVSVKGSDFSYKERQIKLPYPARSSDVLYQNALYLLKSSDFHYGETPIRALGVRTAQLESARHIQLHYEADTFNDSTIEFTTRREALESAADQIRSRFGENALCRGIMLTDSLLSSATHSLQNFSEWS